MGVCKDCKKRTATCHAYCSEYLEECKERERLRAKERADRDYVAFKRIDYKRRIWQKLVQRGRATKGAKK